MNTNAKLLCITPFLGPKTHKQKLNSDQSVRPNCINFRKKKSQILIINPKGTLGFYGAFPVIIGKEKEAKYCMGMYIVHTYVHIYD